MLKANAKFILYAVLNAYLKEEVNRLKKLYDEALQETSTSIRERQHLKVQCAAAIRQWDSALSERNEYKDALAKVWGSN